MPPKRGAAAKRKAAPKKAAGGKKKKVVEEEPEEIEEEEKPATVKEAMEKLKTADTGKKKRTPKPDSHCRIASTTVVHEDYDCMLNQTNIGHNNNKYYVIQVLKMGFHCYAWNRWGRVGEPGQNSLKGPMSADAAIADFKKKFKDKTKNNWDDRASFKPAAGKYTLIEMDDEADEEDTAKTAAKLDELDGVKKVIKPSSLDASTQSLMKLIFDNDMFKEAMKSFDIDVKKMPLGKLSKTQIAKGFEVLEEIDDCVKNNKKSRLTELTSRFYTLIPHDFGRQRPPIINDQETVRQKMDMLLVLADIELAQAMQKDKDKKAAASDTEELENPLDENYKLLLCDLEVLGAKSKEMKVIEDYLAATGGGWRNPKIQKVWKVNRDGEGDRFDAHDKLGNRKLLWHGTNVAVVAAILKGGLRIMPHSGGRVGRGIYFASENSKSAGYVRCAGNTGIMFLNEVALGKEHHITMDDWTLTAAPKGYDCIIAKGRTEPDPKKDTNIELDGNKVTVPQGKPVHQSKYASSSFSQSEYLVYKESQCRIRYLLKMSF